MTTRVTKDYMQVNTGVLLGRTTASAGVVEEITPGAGLSLAAGSLTATQASTGEISAETAVTKYISPDRLSSSKRVADAWCTFNAIESTGTYVQTDLDVTVTLTAHGLSVGMIVGLNYTSGTAVDGSFVVITTPTADSFTVTAAAPLSTSGDVTMDYVIRDQFGVASLTDNGTGDYTVNFSPALSNANYSVGLSVRSEDAALLWSGMLSNAVAPTTSALRIFVMDSTPQKSDCGRVSVQVFCG